MPNKVIREFAASIGISWSKKFGNTTEFSRRESEDVSETSLVIGVHAWF